MDDKPRRWRQSNWHRLIFYGSVAVAGAMMLAKAAGHDPFALVTDPSTRNYIRRFHRDRGHRIVQWFPGLFQDEVPHASAPPPSLYAR